MSEVGILERPAHISVYVWERSKMRAEKYILRAHEAFPNSSKYDLKKRCESYMKIDLSAKEK